MIRKNLIPGNILSLLFVMLTFTACTDNDNPTGTATPLRMAVMVNNTCSRAVIDSEGLTEESAIGLMMVDASGTTYETNNYRNIECTTTDGATWTPAQNLAVTGTTATLYAYHPYTPDVDMTAIPVTAGDTDWMYATKVSGITNDNADVTLLMNHALACLRIDIVKGAYSGDGVLTQLTITSDALSTEGFMNATTGAVTVSDSGTNTYTRTLSTTLTDEGLTVDIVVVPTGTTADLTFTVVVDEKEYYVTVEDVSLIAGDMYQYGLKLEKLTWDNASNGVYAVAADGSPVTYADADESCIAVALVVGEHKFWIEKNETKNTTSIKAAYTEDGASNTYYTYFHWGMYGSDNTSITNYTQTGGGGTSSYGYLPQADGSYANSSNNLSGDYTTWTSGALSDFNGKANTAALLAASDTDSYTTYANMATWCRIFNQTATENQGYTDWYIPACGQLSLIYLNMTAINAALTKIGGRTISSGYYWSSSEYSSYYGWYVDFSNGFVYFYNKRYTSRVRFVRDVK